MPRKPSTSKWNKKSEVTPKEVEGEVLSVDPWVKYDPSLCSKLVEVAAAGGHIPQMCLAIGIKSKDTFYRWLNEYPDFKEAYEESKLVSQAFYENVLLMGGLGKIPQFNFSSLAMIMNNKFSDDYKRTTHGANTEINIGAINNIEKLDSSALDGEIKRLQKQLNLIPAPVVEADEESIDD